MFAEGGCIHVELDAKAVVKQKEILNLRAVKPFVQRLSLPKQSSPHLLPNAPALPHHLGTNPTSPAARGVGEGRAAPGAPRERNLSGLCPCCVVPSWWHVGRGRDGDGDGGAPQAATVGRVSRVLPLRAAFSANLAALLVCLPGCNHQTVSHPVFGFN